MPYPTTAYRTEAAWRKAGCPIGGVFPVKMWAYDPRWGERWPARYVQNGKPLQRHYYVMLPNGQTWCPWSKAYNQERGYHGEGWDVSGPPERLTAKPSIAVNGYHGWLTDGVLSDG